MIYQQKHGSATATAVLRGWNTERVVSEISSPVLGLF
ncbi:hypothetical protein SAMN06265377_3284 [Flagellimonas pacifica]|uniref:Uncharacterized protein n=1 Tax=Flagellimonas pacifica TaxID=1247520 RepID=A0A285MW72_9FLAO|nr:hypothetical protein SAMN06265377_3284 [Allomuricauda parva]